MTIRRPAARLRRALVAGVGPGVAAAVSASLALLWVAAPAAAQLSHPTARTFLVGRGDTVWAIARATGDTVGQLERTNRIGDPRHLRAGARLVIPPPAGPPPGRAGTGGAAAVLRRHPERLALLPAFRRAAAAAGVPTTLLEAVDWQESGWQNQVVSSAHAVGVGQVMPDTIRFVNQALAPVVLNPSLAPSNIALGAWYLGYLLRRTGGDQRLAVASYYQGLTSVRSQGMLVQTRRYVTSVVALQHLFNG